jgi:hypothetical protein
MGTERQIAANRRNASKSSGPRSRAGRLRVRLNARRHGLRANIGGNEEREKSVERLARKIAKEFSDPDVRDAARDFAEAEHDLALIRQIKDELMENCSPATGVDDNAMMTEREEQGETIEWTLPKFVTLDRYERRAEGRRARALHWLISRKKELSNF